MNSFVLGKFCVRVDAFSCCLHEPSGVSHTGISGSFSGECTKDPSESECSSFVLFLRLLRGDRQVPSSCCKVLFTDCKGLLLGESCSFTLDVGVFDALGDRKGWMHNQKYIYSEKR